MGSIVGSVVGSVASSALSSALGGGSKAPKAPNIQVWQPPGLDANAGNWQTLINQNMANNPYGAYQSQFNDVFNKQYGNPYAVGAQDAANAGGIAYGNVGNQSIGASGALNNAGMSLIPYAQQMLNTGFDPQSALRDRTQQMLTDQVRAGQAARGITTSPYGAGVENKALSDFDIDWENQKLNRQISALGGAGTAVNAAGSAAGTANNLGTAGAGALVTGGAVPYSTAAGQSADQYAALSNIINAKLGSNQVNQTTIQDLLQYLQLGAGQSNAQANATALNYQNQMGQYGNQAVGANNLFGGLSSAAGNGIGGFLSSALTVPSFNAGAFMSGLPWSDRRLKENIKRVGKHKGLPWYEFNYKGGAKKYRGYMADDVMQVRPDAVGERDGYQTVDYSKLGTRMREVA